MPDVRYTLGETAAGVYDRQRGDREGPLATAREMAELTIPSSFPPEGYRAGDRLPGNNQSIGARCVKNLASRLMFMAFPPGRPMLKFEPIEHRLKDEIDREPELWSKIQLALSRKEKEHRRRATTTSLGTAYTGMMEQLLIAGNCLWQHVDLDHPVYHRLDKYVTIRDAKGLPLVTILKETVRVVALDDDVQDLVYAYQPDLAKVPEWERTADIYTVLKLDTVGTERRWLYWQEFEGEMIPDTDLDADFDDPPMFPHWLIPVFGSNYGLSYCEQYRGDLFIVENGSSSLNDGASVAALTLLFVKPGSSTSLEQVKKADNLEVLPGKADDVTAFRLDKGGDFQFVSNHTTEAGKRLSFAFLLDSAIQRSGERVTAEEWKRMGAELDRAMGGLYTQLAQTTQRYIVLRFVSLHDEDDKTLPDLPKGVVRVAVITGLDALGATTEEEALVGWAGEVGQAYGPQTFAAITNPIDYARRLAAEKGIQTSGLLKDEATMAAEKQAAAQQSAQMTLMDKGVGPAIKALGDQIPSQLQTQAEGMNPNG